MTTDRLIRPCELDEWLSYPRGRSQRLARKKLIPCIELPDGEIRFDLAAIEKWLAEHATPTEEDSAVKNEQNDGDVSHDGGTP